MSPFAISLLVFACVFGGALLGMACTRERTRRPALDKKTPASAGACPRDLEAYFETATKVMSSVLLSITATPHAVFAPEPSNLQPTSPAA